ncbi:MAG: hypothetical protein ACKVQB_04380 [Bacteroidia bacterium]
MKTYCTLLLGCVILLFVSSCKKKDDVDPPTPLKDELPEFFKASRAVDWGILLPDFNLIANNIDKISIPQDLDFNPTKTNELWIVNKGTESTGSNTVTLTNAGEVNQEAIYKKDGNAYHFMSLTSGLAFSENGNWGSSPNVLDANHQGGRYTGPTLWSSDFSIYGVIGNPPTQKVNGSHLDMVHQSPYCMGIAAERENVFWVFDGYYNNIIRYDFAADHGPGQDYHADAKLKRYNEVTVKRDATLPSHLILDKDKKWLYIVDGGNKRILRMDITTGIVAAKLPPVSEVLAEYSRMEGATWEVFYDQNLQKPCGIEIKDNRLFVSDYATGEIICFDVNTKKEMARINTGSPGIMGIKIHNGKLWYVNATNNAVMIVEPK